MKSQYCRHRRPRHQRRHRRAVILVLVLLLIALSATIASQVASHTIRLSSQAARSEKEMQERWAIVSMRRTLLDGASSILVAPGTNPETVVPIPASEFDVVLSRVHYHLVLQDESAKAPVARMLGTKPEQEVKPLLRELLGSRALLRPVIASKPSRWMDVVQGSRQGVSEASEFLQWGRSATLWSDGQVNVLTADRRALDAIWRLQLGRSVSEPLVRSLEEIRRSGQRVSVDQIGLSDQEKQRLGNWLTTSSNCFSLLIHRTADGNPTNRWLYVKRTSPGFADESFGFHP
jgi:hypothetical protein